MCLVWSWRRRHLDNCDCDKVNTLGRPRQLPLFWWFILSCPPGPGSTWPKHRHTPTRPPQTCPPPRQPTVLSSATLAAVLVPPLVLVPWCLGASVQWSPDLRQTRGIPAPPRPAQPYPPSALLVTRQLSSPLSTAGQGKTEIKDHSIVSRLLNNVCSIAVFLFYMRKVKLWIA